jgi:hypothetical protein
MGRGCPHGGLEDGGTTGALILTEHTEGSATVGARRHLLITAVGPCGELHDATVEGSRDIGFGVCVVHIDTLP